MSFAAARGTIGRRTAVPPTVIGTSQATVTILLVSAVFELTNGLDDPYLNRLHSRPFEVQWRNTMAPGVLVVCGGCPANAHRLVVFFVTPETLYMPQRGCIYKPRVTPWAGFRLHDITPANHTIQHSLPSPSKRQPTNLGQRLGPRQPRSLGGVHREWRGKAGHPTNALDSAGEISHGFTRG